MRLRWGLIAGLGVLILLGVSGVAAQEVDEAERELLRAATQHEAAGELAEAESLLRRLLDHRAATAPALLALERVLRIQGRVAELVPLVEAALDSDPRSALLNQLRLRTYSSLDRPGDLDRAAREWMAAVPGTEIPYREMARIWEARGEPGRARSVLEEGRRRIGRPDALALPLADVYAELGEWELVVAEWDRSIDAAGRGLLEVQRRIRAMPNGRPLVRALVDRLAGEGGPRGRLEAGLELALEAGLVEEARDLAERILPGLAVDDGRVLLEDVARRADGAGATELAFWAYGALLDVMERQRYAAARTRAAEESGSDELGRLLAVRNRLAELALALGDTAAAATGYRAVEEAFDEGSPQRRAAAALRIELMAAGNVDEAVAALTRFRAAHDGTPELDRVAVTVAGALARADRPDEAEAVLAGVRGPRSTVLRARLLLERGEVSAAREAYMDAVPGLRGVEATGVLRLATLLGRLSVPAASRLAEALRLRDAERSGAAVDRLVADAGALEAGDLPPLLDFAAGLADDAGLDEDARRIRRRIVTDHPRSLEAPEALLALGRDLGRELETRDEARDHLERLIIEYPWSALVPQARRALERLRSGGPA